MIADVCESFAKGQIHNMQMCVDKVLGDGTAREQVGWLKRLKDLWLSCLLIKYDGQVKHKAHTDSFTQTSTDSAY